MNKKILFSIIGVLVLVVIGELVYFSTKEEPAKMVAVTQTNADVVMYKRPNCGCCEKWATYMRAAGYTVEVRPTNKLMEVKQQHGIPIGAASCHTALIGDYVIEGHVPVDDIKKLLAQDIDAAGLVVPGMPQGSPGMPSPNPQPYKVYLLGNDGNLSVFAEHGKL